MGELKIFEFSGSGNYSISHGWDNGLECNVSKSTTLEEALQNERNMQEYNGWSYGLPKEPKSGVFYCENEYGGSRNVFGYVIAYSIFNATSMVEQFQRQWPKTRYVAN